MNFASGNLSTLTVAGLIALGLFAAAVAAIWALTAAEGKRDRIRATSEWAALVDGYAGPAAWDGSTYEMVYESSRELAPETEADQFISWLRSETDAWLAQHTPSEWLTPAGR